MNLPRHTYDTLTPQQIIARLTAERNAARRENERLTRAVEALEAQIAVLLAANATFGREGDRYE